MEVEGILYETLRPLSAAGTTTTATDDIPPSLSSSDEHEPYVVFRNQISLSNLQCPSPETAAPDYFSLDLDGDASDLNNGSVSTPVPAATPLRDKEVERGLEGNWFRANCRFKSPMLQLHQEIIDFCEFLSPTLEEQASRNEAVECVFNVIKYIWPNCKPEVFGSFKTGLYLPTSDVDLVILGSEIRSPQIGLQALSRALSQKGVAKKIQVISKARVPIIKFVEKKSGISFDISFDVENGPKAADFIKDAMSSWPPLRPLCLILKVFLQQRELNEVYTGGIGSYALLVMLIAMLQNHRNGQASVEENLGILLVNFFDIYGRKLNTSDVGVSCNGEATFFLKSCKGFSIKGKQSLISIEDPQTPENDIGKSSFNYFQVRSAFSMAFTTLTNAKAIFALGPNRSILGTIIRPDEVLVERKGGSNGEVTFTNLLPGAGEGLQQYGDQQEIYCNWQLNDNEEALPRGNGIAENGGAESSGKKRKSSKDKQPAKKVKENGHSSHIRDEENSSRKEKSSKKHWKHNRW
ncbi:nucleotidyltransferase family protein [Solanum lycopersicum]|uniref:nucleotidyltransferase family protein n=1 Tax=Solanum lycopersicum TaxID=4081 RepID=UPI000276AFBF|nr:nucleotidyltransferase family protein [Solanum lycopersicum]